MRDKACLCRVDSSLVGAEVQRVFEMPIMSSRMLTTLQLESTP